MSSPNLAAPHVAAAQNQKEVTINDATDALDLALTASAEVDCTAGGNVSVPLATARRALRLVLTGTPASGFDLVLPNITRAFILRNETGTSALVRRMAGGASVDLSAGVELLVYCDGTHVRLITPPAPERVYDFGMLAGPAPEADAVLGKVVLPRAMTLPADFAGAQAHVDTPPDAAFEIRVLNDAALIGEITLAPDGSASFATAGNMPITITPGAIIRFLAPDTADPGISGIAITLTGTLV